MVEYKTCQMAHIIADAKAHGRVEELKAYGLGKVKGKDGKKRARTFLEIKKNYYQTYYPEMLPVAKPKEKTIYDLLAEL